MYFPEGIYFNFFNISLKRIFRRPPNAIRLQIIIKKLYDGKEPSSSVIKADLDFVSNHWQDPCFDLWEEVNGTHFYTRMQQRTALREGAALAKALKVHPGIILFPDFDISSVA